MSKPNFTEPSYYFSDCKPKPWTCYRCDTIDLPTRGEVKTDPQNKNWNITQLCCSKCGHQSVSYEPKG